MKWNLKFLNVKNQNSNISVFWINVTNEKCMQPLTDKFAKKKDKQNKTKNEKQFEFLLQD